jgi:hypothetical protein
MALDQAHGALTVAIVPDTMLAFGVRDEFTDRSDGREEAWRSVW